MKKLFAATIVAAGFTGAFALPAAAYDDYAPPPVYHAPSYHAPVYHAPPVYHAQHRVCLAYDYYHNCIRWGYSY